MTPDLGRRYRHRLSLELVHFTAGKAMWRGRCACGWHSDVKVDDANAALHVALAHTGGYVFGTGACRDSLLELPRNLGLRGEPQPASVMVDASRSHREGAAGASDSHREGAASDSRR